VYKRKQFIDIMHTIIKLAASLFSSKTYITWLCDLISEEKSVSKFEEAKLNT